jgi:hypothetical protein
MIMATKVFVGLIRSCNFSAIGQNGSHNSVEARKEKDPTR